MSERIPKEIIAFGFRLPVVKTKDKKVRAKVLTEIRFDPIKMEYTLKPIKIYVRPDLPHPIRKKSIKHELAHILAEKEFVEKWLNPYVKQVKREVTRYEYNQLRRLFGGYHGWNFIKYAKKLKASYYDRYIGKQF
jgi:hypothetical protein